MIPSSLKSSQAVILIGSLIIVFSATLGAVYWPALTMPDKPSEIWRPMNKPEELGRMLYINNGCTYCHSQYIRPQDWGIGAERIAQMGDYYRQQPHLLGSERTGPDLSQEGGEHTNDWHVAHFMNPRWTSTRSLMPRFGYFKPAEIDALIAYVQGLGGEMANARMDQQRKWRREVLAAYRLGPDENIRWLHSRVPRGWRILPNPYPASPASLKRGEKVYQDYCLGCHGPVGDGNGPAAPHLEPRPLNFTTLQRHLIEDKFIGGIIYYQVMNGITGSAMPYFKKHLESAKIWDVGNYVSVYFINHRDDQYLTEGIPSSYEGHEAGPSTPEPQPGPFEPGIGEVR